MKKYITAFNLEFQRILSFRFNFFIGRLRSVIVMLVLYFFWTGVAGSSRQFAGYSHEQLLTYVFLVNILRSVVFGGF
jgi:ABC-2 type transport system permease protein